MRIDLVARTFDHLESAVTKVVKLYPSFVAANLTNDHKMIFIRPKVKGQVVAATCLRRPSIEAVKQKKPIPWVPLQWISVYNRPCHAQISVDGLQWSHPFPMSE